jgi:hypothetical protein
MANGLCEKRQKNRVSKNDRLPCMDPEIQLVTQIQSVDNTLKRIAHALEALAKASNPDFKNLQETERESRKPH